MRVYLLEKNFKTIAVFSTLMAANKAVKKIGDDSIKVREMVINRFPD